LTKPSGSTQVFSVMKDMYVHTYIYIVKNVLGHIVKYISRHIPMRLSSQLKRVVLTLIL
jgi:hypothetical protein